MDEMKVRDKQTGKEVVIPVYAYDPNKHSPIVTDIEEPVPVESEQDKEMSNDNMEEDEVQDKDA